MAGKLKAFLRYISWYLIGIVAAILLTRVSPILAGVHIWPYYIALPGISYVLFYALTPEYVMGATVGYWVIHVGGLVTLLLGLATLLPPARQFRRLRPPLVGLPLGFLGAMGVFYTAAASI